MGQRLVFECVKDDMVFATLYFHWSAYTYSTYCEAIKIINGLRKRGYDPSWTIEQIQKCLADILYEDRAFNLTDSYDVWTGGISQDSIEAFKKIGYDVDAPRKGKVNRNTGLIDISEDGMAEAVKWAEQIETMDFDEEIFTHNCYDMIERDDDPEWYDAMCESMDIDDIPLFDPPEGYMDVIPWYKAEEALNWYYETYVRSECMQILGKLTDGSLVVPIE